jgi:hypothetical protein
MTLNQQEVDELDLALNESGVDGIRIRDAGPEVELLVHVAPMDIRLPYGSRQLEVSVRSNESVTTVGAVFYERLWMILTNSSRLQPRLSASQISSRAFDTSNRHATERLSATPQWRDRP